MAKKPNIQKEIFGTLPDVKQYGTVLTWSKKGGYAGEKTLARIVQRAMDKGFVQRSNKATGTPDGSHMGTGEVFKAPTGECLTINYSYGVTKDKNYFFAELRLNG